MDNELQVRCGLLSFLILSISHFKYMSLLFQDIGSIEEMLKCFTIKKSLT